MKFQIAAIVLYGYNRRQRTLRLHLDSVNIITGPTGTGKSSLLDIVDFCLGSSEYRICHGVISERVAWFGLLLQLQDRQVFVARRNRAARGSMNDIFLREGVRLEIPEFDELHDTIGCSGLRERLSALLGIQQYGEGGFLLLDMLSVRVESQEHADIRKALVYCFQGQSEIANKDMLFHKSGEKGSSNAQISHFFPYFAGIIDAEMLRRMAQLQQLKRELRRLQQQYEERRRLQGDNFERAFSLLKEAMRMGLLPSCELEPSWDALRPLFQQAVQEKSEACLPELSAGQDGIAERQALQDACRELREEISDERRRWQALSSFGESQQGHIREGIEQRARLRSLDLYSHATSDSRCPLCHSPVGEQLPQRSAVAAALAGLDRQLADVERDSSLVRKLLESSRVRLEELRGQLREKEVRLRELEKSSRLLADMASRDVQRSFVRGKLAVYLESLPVRDADDESLEERIQALDRQRELEEEQLSEVALKARSNSVQGYISADMSRIMRALGGALPAHDYKLNMHRCTVYAIGPGGQYIPLANMGSGKTWVSAHLAAHLALHRFFVRAGSPVPQFLFLDQPSQVFYPPDTHAENRDREAVARMLRVLKREVQGFQVIVTEHVSLKDPAFQECVRESWWEGDGALVPQNWL